MRSTWRRRTSPYRVVPDAEAEVAEQERNGLRLLTRILDWRSEDHPDDEEFADLPEKLCEGLKESTAFNLILNWVNCACIDTLLAEIGEEFNGIDPLRPIFREKLESTREELWSVHEWLKRIRIEVKLREPLEEELQDMRDWLSELPAEIVRPKVTSPRSG